MSLESVSAIHASVEEARHIFESDPSATTRARMMLEAYLREHPEDWHALELELEILSRVKERKLARALLDEYLSCYPNDERAATANARIMWEMGEQEEAFAEAKALVARNPQNIAAQETLARFARVREDAPVAEAAANAVLAEDGENVTALSSLAWAQEQLVKLDLARATWARLETLPIPLAMTIAHVRFLLKQNLVAEALQLVSGYCGAPTSSPTMHLLGAECAFRSNLPATAIPWLERIFVAREPFAASSEIAADAIQTALNSMGRGPADTMLFRLLETGAMVDTVSVEFLEACGQRGHRGHLIRIFNFVSRRPLEYPRTMARILSTYYDAPYWWGSIGRWVAANPHVITQNTRIWGGVGAWNVAKGNWSAAINQLSRWPERRGPGDGDVAAWMVLLYAIALEHVSRFEEANDQLRAALTLPPDHAEPAIRSRLAWNLALLGNPAAGKLVLMDYSEDGKRYSTFTDEARGLAVAALVRIEQSKSWDEGKETIDTCVAHLKQAAKQNPSEPIATLIRDFRRRGFELLQRIVS